MSEFVAAVAEVLRAAPPQTDEAATTITELGPRLAQLATLIVEYPRSIFGNFFGARRRPTPRG